MPAVRAHHGMGLYLGQDDDDFYSGLPGLDTSAPPVVPTYTPSPLVLSPAPAPALPTLYQPASNAIPFGTDANGQAIFLGPNGYTDSLGRPMTPEGVVTPLEYNTAALNAQASGQPVAPTAPRVTAPGAAASAVPSPSVLQSLTSALMAPVATMAKPAAAVAAPGPSLLSGTSGMLLLAGGGLLLVVMMMGRK